MKSKPIDDIKLLVNKTIVKAVRPGGGVLLFLQFDDNTHMFIEVESEYNVALFNFNPHVNNEDMREVGLISDDEYQAILADNERIRQRSRDMNDRITYEHLKAKFEGDNQ